MRGFAVDLERTWMVSSYILLRSGETAPVSHIEGVGRVSGAGMQRCHTLFHLVCTRAAIAADLLTNEWQLNATAWASCITTSLTYLRY